MTIIKVQAEKNSGHDNLSSETSLPVPEGWAVVPEDMLPLEHFPFGEAKAEQREGVPTLTEWIPGEIPEETLTPAETREKLYDTLKCVEWDGDTVTVTAAAKLWEYYAAEGSGKATRLTELIAAAKAEIRRAHPDEEAEE